MKKYISGVFLAVLMCMILLPMQARAESSDEFLLDGKTGTVTICSQHAGEEALSSLQFSISIDSADADKISFEFGETNAKITEFRYDEETNRLNIYMAGVDPLFAKGGDTLTVGKIVVQDSNGNAVDANVSVVEHSLQYVYGTELKPMDEVDDPGTVLIGPSALVQPSTPPSTQAPPAEVTPQPEQPGQSDRPQQSDEPQQPAQTPPAAQETPDPGSSGTDDDPNAGWNPGWQDPGDNSSEGNNNSTAQTPQGTGGGKKKPTAGKGTGTKVAGAGTTKPSASPAPSVSPSPEPEASEPVTEPESSAEEGNTEEEDIIISTMGSTEETDSEETGSEETKETETKGKTDWLMIVVVIAIVVFVAVGAIAVVVLKGKQKPHNRRG